MSGLFTVSMNRPAGRSRKSVMSYDGNESSVLTGTVSESIGYSTGSSSTALAADRWSVEKRRQEWDREMQAFRHREQSRMKFLQLTSDHRAMKLHEKIFFCIRWANPNLSKAHEKLFLKYCQHLLGPLPDAPFQKAKVLNAWNDKCRATVFEKASIYIASLCTRLRNITVGRDTGIVNTHENVVSKLTQMEFKRDAELTWKTEGLKGLRDKYWTTWFLSSQGLVTELKRLLDTTPQPRAPAAFLTVTSKIAQGDTQVKSRHNVSVDEKDPDFGLTAAHYAARRGHIEVMKLLFEYGANVKETTPDGRTALHLAAAYSSKEMVRLLLGEGADMFTLDNFKCTPMDLARQNGNLRTLAVLSNWNNLLPPCEDDFEPSDGTQVLAEFLATPSHVLDLMSPRLQILCSRLDGDGKMNGKEDGILDPNILLRLCQSHSMMCLEEGFDKEGIKISLRRWRVAKSLYAACQASSQPTAPSSSSASTYKSEGSVLKIQEMFSESKHGYFIPEGIEGDRIRILSDAIIKRKLKKLSPSGAAPPTNVHMTSVALSEVGRDLSERLILDGQERFAMTILLECAVLPGLEPTTVIGILARYCETSVIVVDLYKKLLKGRLAYRGRGMKEHVEAVAHETKEVKPQDLFERSSTVSYLNTMKRFKQGCAGAKDMNRLNEEKRRTKSSQTHASRNDQVSSQLLYRQAQCISRRVASVWIPRPYGDPVFKTDSNVHVNQILREAQVDILYEPVGQELLSEEMILHSLGRLVEVAHEAIALSVRIQEDITAGHIVESCTLTPLLELLSIVLELRADVIDLGDTLAFISQQEATGYWGAPRITSPLQETADDLIPPLDTENSTSFLPAIDAPRDDLLSTVMESPAEAIQSIAEYPGTPALDLFATLREALDDNFWRFEDIRESRGDYLFGGMVSLDELLESLRVMHRAAVVSERTSGRSSEDTARISLEILRLLIRASTWSSSSAINWQQSEGRELPQCPGVAEIYDFSSYVSKCLYILGTSDVAALDRLTKRYAELISLSRLFQETGGTVLPTVNSFVPKSVVETSAGLKKKRWAKSTL